MVPKPGSQGGGDESCLLESMLGKHEVSDLGCGSGRRLLGWARIGA